MKDPQAPDPRLRLCAAAEIPVAGAGAIERRAPGKPPRFLILLRSQGELLAWENACPHAGRPLNFAPDRFLFSPEGHLVCAVHGATFNARTGDTVSGPCMGASLRPVALTLFEGEVYLVPS